MRRGFRATQDSPLWAACRHKPSGIKYGYQYYDAWGKRYYSFDDICKVEDEQWFSSRDKAFESAQERGVLEVVIDTINKEDSQP